MATLTLQVGASADDGDIAAGFTFSNAGTHIRAGDFSGGSIAFNLWARWTGDFSALVGATIDSVKISGYADTGVGTPETNVYFADAAAQGNPADESAYNAISVTDPVAWDGALTDDAWNDSPELKTIFSPLVTSYGANLTAVMALIKGDSSPAGEYHRFRAYDFSGNAHGAKLVITYTPATNPKPARETPETSVLSSVLPVTCVPRHAKRDAT